MIACWTAVKEPVSRASPNKHKHKTGKDKEHCGESLSFCRLFTPFLAQCEPLANQSVYLSVFLRTQNTVYAVWAGRLVAEGR